jgi:hypothetical protein
VGYSNVDEYTFSVEDKARELMRVRARVEVEEEWSE